MKVIDGKKIANKVKDEIAGKVQEMMKAGQPVPHLAAVIVGDDGAAKTYVDSICRACKEVGFVSSIYHYPTDIKEEEFLQNLDFLNNDDEIDGYIIQMPLPKHINMEKVVEHVDPKKDVDCFHPTNNGKLLLGGADFLPATPYGTVELMRRSGISPKGKHCVVLGRSNIVGKPLALLLAEKADTGDATVTICHSRTQNLKEICATADILLVAIGQPEMITADYVKEGATVIDIGIHRIPDEKSEKGYRICGDVKYDEVSKKCEAITPVPGGVGPMTMTCLLLNTLHARELNRK